MNKFRGVLLVFVLVAALAAVGCSSSDDAVVAKKGTVSVYLGSSSKAAGDAELNLTLSRLVLRDRFGGDAVSLIEDGTQTVNLMGDNFLGAFAVPVGTYHCIGLTVDGMTVVEGGNTCEKSNIPVQGLSLEEICLQSGVLQVQEDGTYEMLIEFPSLSASCPADQGTAIIGLSGGPSVSLR